MVHKAFERLINRGFLTSDDFRELTEKTNASGNHPEALLRERNIPRHEMLLCLSSYFGYSFIEYDEGIVVGRGVLQGIDAERLKGALWFPLSVSQNRAEVIACDPSDPIVIEDIRRTLKVGEIDFLVALPSDLIRIIENNQDLNPHFPQSAGRTPLAKVRTFLAEKRSLFACYRTSFAKGRTGLAFLRTGISLITVATVLFRVFGAGYLNIVEALLLLIGSVMTVDGVIWYLPARRTGNKSLRCSSTHATCGTTVLEVSNPGNNCEFSRSAVVEGADLLRKQWSTLSPVMRRRYLASDRTDLAEERTTLACHRTKMARARTGLSFTRTGVAFVGLGIGLLRQFNSGPWTIFDAALILSGIVMGLEGFHWYMPGRRAGTESARLVQKNGDGESIWDLIFPTSPADTGPSLSDSSPLRVRPSSAPGIWATTGLALERTLLAERRNVMARLRTIMARSRTGMAFIRTGMSITAVGLGLLVYFGNSNVVWTAFEVLTAALGMALIADGIYWYVPAERIRRQFPYCFGEMEIALPDYGVPTRSWKKVVFSHDDI